MPDIDGVVTPICDTGAARRTPAANSSRAFWVAGTACVALLYVSLFCCVSPLFSLLDLPNHLARGVVMADLMFHQGLTYGSQFEFRFLLVPYILGDLILSGAVALAGPQAAAAFFTCLAFVSVPLALLVYMRVLRVPVERQLPVLLLSFYLSTDWFFTMGFLAYRLSLAWLLLAVAAAERLRQRPSVTVFVLFAGALLAGYLTHLSMFVFAVAALAVAAAVRLWFRNVSVRVELALFAPLLAVAIWHVLFASGYRDAGDAAVASYYWGTAQSKLWRLGSELHRFPSHLDEVLPLLFLLAVATLAAGKLTRSAVTKPPVIEMLAVAVTFLAIYIVLPIGYRDAWFVDVRALAPALLFFLLAVVRLPEPAAVDSARGHYTLAASLALSLVSLNLVVLVKVFRADNMWAADYRSVVAAIPPGANVLPINTRHTTAPYLHAASIAVIDRQAFIPTLFSANSGDPVRYFRYRNWPYSPPENWYTSTPSAPVDWSEIGCTYQYLLVVKPFDSSYIHTSVTAIAEGESATLLKVSPQLCKQASLSRIQR